MKYHQMLSLLDESGCSPEEFGELMGVSGMTLRRWQKKSKSSELPKVYVPALREACFQLIAQGRLEPQTALASELLTGAHTHQYSAALHNLGITEGFTLDGASNDGVLLGLSQIGALSDKKAEVDGNQTKVLSFRRLGEEWSSLITTLWSVVHSKKLTAMDKLIAYGALFYLLTPIDFIPDQIPFFGLLDDFAVLGIAANYYAKRFTDFA